MKPGATFDSSFWVHAVSLHLVEHLLEDYALVCPTAVETELGQDNLSAVRLKTLCAAGRIEWATPHSEPIPSLTHLCARGRLGVNQVLEALGTLARRGTIKPEWITLGVTLVAELRRQRGEQECQR